MESRGALNILGSQLQRVITSNGVSWSPQHLVKPITKGHHQQWSLVEPSTSGEANYKGHHQQWSLVEPSTSGEANYKGSSPAMEFRGALNIL